ncbi:RmlC-like cupin domain-containing protein [Mycena galericulata]|nr:RmlC-like cupin domain-containing protein [Mycena galericulata]
MRQHCTDCSPNGQLWNSNSRITPEPIRGPLRASILGPHNIPVEIQNSDALAPPTTDNGNMKWSFALSHNRLANGGWARQQNVDSMLVATSFAGVNMRLEPGAGDVRISTITADGQVYLGDVTAGDIWYFPSGNRHYLQAKNTTEGGAEFLLVFDSGKSGAILLSF